MIGKGGANIRKIREETSTRIDLPPEGSDSDMIVITGRKENVEKARDHILKIQSELVSWKAPGFPQNPNRQLLFGVRTVFYCPYFFVYVSR